MIATQQSNALRRVESWVEHDRERRARDQARAQYAFDSAGDLTAIMEASGGRAEFRYDQRRRLIETIRDGIHTRYAYDSSDRLSEIISHDAPRRFEFDAQGRILAVHRGTAGGVVYRYDSSGRVAEFRTAEVSTEHEFDDAGRIRCVRQTINGVVLEAHFAFDDGGRLSGTRLPGARLAYTWNAKGRPLSVSADDQVIARFEYVDAYRIVRLYSANGVVEESIADSIDGRPVSREWRQAGRVLDRREYAYDNASRLASDGGREYEYDRSGRLASVTSTGSEQAWKYAYDDGDNRISPRGPADDRVYRIDDAGQLIEARIDGDVAGQFTYDAKGRMVLARTPGGTLRYLYGPADELLAVTGEQGQPVRVLVHTPVGCVAEKRGAQIVFTHSDERGTRLFVTAADGQVLERFEYDAFGLPLDAAPNGACFTGRFWFPAARLYYFGARWYDPAAGRFITPDSQTAAPDDDRITGPLYPGATQAMLRRHLLSKWLDRPRLRNRYAFCGNDPVNCVDPNGHWSFGRVLLMLLGAIWTLPNTIFGLLVEITCLIGEVIRWLVFVFTLGHVSWATPGFDVAASGNLNAFALVFRGGWLGSFSSLLGITFGNVFFVYTDWESTASLSAGGDVSPPGHGGSVTIPLKDALYEHELRHTVQYSWFGPFFHLGLPIFGVYEWDVIVHGYEDAWLERDARAFGGF
jgi:RHS repeat-associated protein